MDRVDCRGDLMDPSNVHYYDGHLPPLDGDHGSCCSQAATGVDGEAK